MHIQRIRLEEKIILERTGTKDTISQNDSVRKYAKLAWELGLNLASDISRSCWHHLILYSVWLNMQLLCVWCQISLKSFVWNVSLIQPNFIKALHTELWKQTYECIIIGKRSFFFFILFPVLHLQEQNNHCTNIRTCSTSRSYYQKKYIWFLLPPATNKNILPLAQEMLRLSVAQSPLDTTAILKSPSQNTYQPWFCHVKHKTRHIWSLKIQQHLIAHWTTAL